MPGIEIKDLLDGHQSKAKQENNVQYVAVVPLIFVHYLHTFDN